MKDITRAPKVVCTIGPSTSTTEQIKKLISAGMNVVRLNFSHGDHPTHRATVRSIRRIAAEMHTSIGILQDLQGPKIRMNASLPDSGVSLELGKEVVLASSHLQLPIQEALPVDYEMLASDVQVGDPILFSDGKMAAQVKEIKGAKVICTVTKPGILLKRKGVNMPESNLSIPAMTPKDFIDLELGLELEVDYVALSFVREASDMNAILKRFKEIDTPPLLLAKIEKPQAVTAFDEILRKLDGIMVARGDLGVEMAFEYLPPIQKEIIRKTVAAGKFVITATQMLLSMVDSSLPTRAEVSDVANALYDGSDAVMLSDETAAGKFPIQSCQTMSKIAKATTQHLARVIRPTQATTAGETASDKYALGYSACTLARDSQAKYIVACTSSGATAVEISRFRPTCPILAITPSEKTYSRLAMYWGVRSLYSEEVKTTEDLSAEVRKILEEQQLVQPKDKIVLVIGSPLHPKMPEHLLQIISI